jgi:hypothetical protein
MRLPQLFLALCVIVGMAPLAEAAPRKAPSTPYHRAVDPFIAELNRQCPGRALQNLAAGDLALIQEGFVETLTVAQRHTVEDAVGQRCARIEAGLTCANTASLDAFRRLSVLPRFTAAACATRWTCKGVADCAEARP